MNDKGITRIFSDGSRRNFKWRKKPAIIGPVSARRSQRTRRAVAPVKPGVRNNEVKPGGLEEK